jgi:hypothetical protein
MTFSRYDEHPISSSETSSPPPLPNRIGSGKNSAFQRVHSGNGQGSESPLFANSSSTNSSPSIYQHPPPPRMKVPGDPSGQRFNGYDPSNGKTQNRPFANSPKNAPPVSAFSHEEKRSGEARVTYLVTIS